MGQVWRWVIHNDLYFILENATYHSSDRERMLEYRVLSLQDGQAFYVWYLIGHDSNYELLVDRQGGSWKSAT